MVTNFILAKYLKLILISWALILINSAAMAQVSWKILAPGIEYAEITKTVSQADSHLHVFRIDLKYNKLDLALATEHHVAAASVKTLATKNNALIAMNGGFFTPQLQPIGLRIKQGAIRSKLKMTSWWGVFYIEHNKAHIISQSDYRYQQGIEFAVQGGPRLVINGMVVPKLKSGVDERSALGITQNGKVILAITDDTPLETTSMASIMQAPEAQDGLACHNAINLDGGNSSQLYAQIGNFMLNVPGFSFVTDAVLVVAKQL